MEEERGHARAHKKPPKLCIVLLNNLSQVPEVYQDQIQELLMGKWEEQQLKMEVRKILDTYKKTFIIA